MITSVIRICAVVGMTAVAIAGNIAKSRNGYGLINQNPYINGNPYNCNSGDDTMYNNAYGSQSRRFFNGFAPQPQPVMATMGYPNNGMVVQPAFQRPLTFGPSQLMPSPQLQATLSQYGYPTPGYNNGGYPAMMNMNYQPSYSANMYSRRNMPGNYNPFVQQQPQQPMNNYGMDLTNGVYRESSYVDPAVQSLYGNYTSCNYGYGYDNNNNHGYDAINPTNNWNMYQQPQQTYQQNYTSQPMSLANYNSIIGSAARFKYWSPSTSYGTGVTYYGYDERCPAYPPPTESDIRSMQMAQQMNVRPIPQPIPQPMMQKPMPFQPQQMFGRQMPQPSMNMGMQSFSQPQPQQTQQPQQMMPGQMEFESMFGQKIGGLNKNDIHSFGDTTNAWYSVNEINCSQPQQQQPPQSNVVPPLTPPPAQTPPPQTPITQMTQPQQAVEQTPMQQQIQEPQSDTEVSIDAILALGRPPMSGEQFNPDTAPIPNHRMTFGSQENLVTTSRSRPSCFMI